MQQQQKRADELKREKALKKEYKITRIFIFMTWIFANLVVGYIMSQFRKENMTSFLVFVSYCLVIFQLVKLFGSLVYFFRIRQFKSQMQNVPWGLQKRHKLEESG